MKKIILSAIIVVFCFCPAIKGDDDPAVKLVPIYENLKIERPISLMVPDDGTGRRFLVEQTGKIKILPADEGANDAKLFLDMGPLMSVEKNFEEGVMGLAFHPDYAKNGKFYLSFSRQGPKRMTISEFSVSKSDPDKADPKSERVLIDMQVPDWNHHSGNILFGPKDRMLYIVTGEGGFKNGIFSFFSNF